MGIYELAHTIAKRLRPMIAHLGVGRRTVVGAGFGMGIYELAHTIANRLRPMIAHLGVGRSSFIAKAVIMSVICATGITLSEALVREYRDLKTELATARSELAANRQRIARLEIWAAGMVSEQAQSHGGPVRLAEGDSRLRNAAPDAPIELLGDEVHLLREYIKVPPAPEGTTPTITLGGLVDEHRLLPLPPQIADRAPILMGARFTTDRNGAIIIVRRGSNRVNSIVSPTR